VGAGHHDHHDEHDHSDPPALVALLAQRVQRLNRLHTSDWDQHAYPGLASLIDQLLETADEAARHQHPDNPYERDQLVNDVKRQARMLLQSLLPPEELRESFIELWKRLAIKDVNDFSTYARRTIMSAKVRADVMNRQVEESVDEADRIASERRVEAIDADGNNGSGAFSEDRPAEGEAAPAASKPAAPAPEKATTLKQTLRLLKKKRRDIGRHDAEEVAVKALDAMRVLRDEVAPRWAPEAQPWLLNTADNHVYQSVLAVIPAELFRETTAFDGIQRLRAGEHAFSPRASEKLAEAVKRGT
jgi:hypothetical protein